MIHLAIILGADVGTFTMAAACLAGAGALNLPTIVAASVLAILAATFAGWATLRQNF